MLIKMTDYVHQCGSVFQKCELILMGLENNGSL